MKFLKIAKDFFAGFEFNVNVEPQIPYKEIRYTRLQRIYAPEGWIEASIQNRFGDKWEIHEDFTNGDLVVRKYES